MVAVAPSAPKSQVAQARRSAKPAASGADFGRILQETAGENRPAPEAEPAREDHPPEARPEAVSHPKDQAPAQTGEKKTADQGQEKEQEQEPQPERAEGHDAAPSTTAPQPKDHDAAPSTTALQPKDHDAAPSTAAPQPIVPLSAEAAKAAAPVPEQLKAEAGSVRGVAAKAQTLPAPATESGALPSLPAAGKTEASQSRAKGEKTEAPADQLPADQQLDLKTLQPKAAERAPEKSSSADLLSFDELMRPDLKTEVSPEPMLDQLQQAMNAALLDESLVVPQVVRGLATLVSGGMSEMRLQLQPEDLGEIEVRVRTSEGVVRGEMMVQNPEVKQLLDQHLDRLRDALHQQGLDLRGFDIGLAPDGRFAQPDRSGRGFQPQGGARRQAAAASALPEAPALAPRGSLAVDYLA